MLEVVAVRQHPREAPAHALPVVLPFLKRRARDRHQRHVAVAPMHHGAVVVVRPERAARAAFVPIRPEHEVIYEELVSVGEQVGQRFLASGPHENIRLVNFHPRQPASLLAQGVTLLGEGLLLGEQDLARGKPLVSRHDLMRHGSISFRDNRRRTSRSIPHAQRIETTGGRRDAMVSQLRPPSAEPNTSPLWTPK